jgi:hypothetical protein
MYGYRTEEAEAGAALTLTLQDAAFAPLGTLEVPLDTIKAKKPSWQDLGGFGATTVSGPVLINVQAGAAARGAVMIGCDEGKGGGHSFKLVPGSHGEPPGGGYDWMFRLFLTSTETMDRKALDAVVKEYRKAISPR